MGLAAGMINSRIFECVPTLMSSNKILKPLLIHHIRSTLQTLYHVCATSKKTYSQSPTVQCLGKVLKFIKCSHINQSPICHVYVFYNWILLFTWAVKMQLGITRRFWGCLIMMDTTLTRQPCQEQYELQQHTLRRNSRCGCLLFHSLHPHTDEHPWLTGLSKGLRHTVDARFCPPSAIAPCCAC